LGAFAQDAEKFHDPETGIDFSQYSADINAGTPKGGFQLGVAFPQNLDKNEYIGHLVRVIASLLETFGSDDRRSAQGLRAKGGRRYPTPLE
jgi:hypothetical protein